jgi:hypothetical protein
MTIDHGSSKSLVAQPSRPPSRTDIDALPWEVALPLTALAGDRQIGDMRLKPDLSDWDEPLPVGRAFVRLVESG